MLKERAPETDDGLQGEFLATVYDEMQRHIRDNGWLDEKIKILLDHRLDGGHALEIGSGPGYFGLEWLRATKDAQPSARLTGLDISSEMLKVAKCNAEDYGMGQSSAYELGDCQKMPFPDASFDVIFSHSSLHEWVSPAAVFQEIWRVLKPGGRYCIIDLRRNLSKEAISFMRMNINPDMRKGFANSVRAAYTSAELRRMLDDSPLAAARIEEIELGMYFVGGKPEGGAGSGLDIPEQSLSPEQRLERLNATIAHAAADSPFYRARGGLRPLARLEDLAGLPFTAKQDLRDHYPFGMLAAPKSRLVRYAESTGTTGGVTAGFVTQEDWQGNTLCVALAWADIFGKDDTLAIAVPYELSYVGADLDRVAEMLGATALSIGTNNKICSWTRLVHLMRTYSVTGLVCAPIRALRLAEIAKAEGIDPLRDLPIKRIVCVGEPLSDARRRRIESLWGAKVYAHYGMTEAMAVGLPCPAGRLHLAEQRFVFEIVDPATGAAVPLGTPGELVLTTLAQQALPLLRYRTGDLVRGHAEPCPCGSPHVSVEHLGRVDGVIQTPGRAVHPEEFDEILLAEPGIEPIYSVTGGEGQVRFTVMPAQSEAAGSWSEVCARLAAAVERDFGFRPEIAAADREEWQSRIDNRSKPGGALAAARP